MYIQENSWKYVTLCLVIAMVIVLYDAVGRHGVENTVLAKVATENIKISANNVITHSSFMVPYGG